MGYAPAFLPALEKQKPSLEIKVSRLCGLIVELRHEDLIIFNEIKFMKLITIVANITDRAILRSSENISGDLWKFECSPDDLPIDMREMIAARLGNNNFLYEGVLNQKDEVVPGTRLLRIEGTQIEDLIKVIRQDQAAIEKYRAVENTIKASLAEDSNIPVQLVPGLDMERYFKRRMKRELLPEDPPCLVRAEEHLGSRAIEECQSAVPVINGKLSFEIDAKTIINFKSKFASKKLCDGNTFSLGCGCAFSCKYCYVPSMILKLKTTQEALRSASPLGLQDVVIRRRNAVEILRQQLTVNKPGHVDLSKKQVVFTSPLVEPAPNLKMARETAEACKVIFELTNWDIRVLSKGTLLPLLVRMIPEKFWHRLILGVSTGTLDDSIARSFEVGTPSVSKRLESLHELQYMGCRTFGMLCPILPQEDYDSYVLSAVIAIRPERCEHVWAEPINLRGNSLTATRDALKARGYANEAARLDGVCGTGSTAAREEYSRAVFQALIKQIPGDKLRFLQYVNKQNIDWWRCKSNQGAVLLGNLDET